MGYTTEFSGAFNIDKPLHPKLKQFLIKFNESRRMIRNLPEELYGVEGEFYVPEDTNKSGQEHTPDIINYNQPPKTQPGLWCQWTIEDNDIVWDGGEKFYEYEQWLGYLIDKILAPNGYKVNGEVKWQGEEIDDQGKITVSNNMMTVTRLE